MEQKTNITYWLKDALSHFVEVTEKEGNMQVCHDICEQPCMAKLKIGMALNMAEELIAERDRLFKENHDLGYEIDYLSEELEEQCRLNGIGGSRELKLIAENVRLKSKLREEEANGKHQGTSGERC